MKQLKNNSKVVKNSIIKKEQKITNIIDILVAFSSKIMKYLSDIDITLKHLNHIKEYHRYPILAV